MELKKYQRRVVDEVEAYFRAMSQERDQGNAKHAAADAWEAIGLSRYQNRKNGLGEDLPTVCIKVPTGGGKTLLATQILAAIYRTILVDRNGSGLVLWVVPSSQIYRDTVKRLRDRGDLYRILLEHAISRRIEVWEKHEIARLTPARLRECLNILVLQLASTNRETREQLKFFRDSGGNIVQHFPPENDNAAQKKLKAEVRNLDMIEENPAADRYLVATSIGNLVRLCRPAVILDEGHKATSELARRTIEGFNAAAVVELSATPPSTANVISRVSGHELYEEQMIKLPINIATSGQRDWKDVLGRARDKREELARRAVRYAESFPDRYIRPIVLIQVERTGKDQRGGGYVHAKDVEDFLVQKLAVESQAIRIKSAEDDGLEDVDLLDPDCAVEWVITKSALQEGWDCPFAYILVSLNNMGSGRAMTQLVGRVLRQPYQERTPYPDLNESYVYCVRQKAVEILRQVKAALEKEGYEGEIEGAVVDATVKDRRTTDRVMRIRPQFTKLYTSPVKGKIYLPRFAIKSKTGYRSLDYYEHLVNEVDIGRFAYNRIDWSLGAALTDAKDRFYRLSLGSDAEQVSEAAIELVEPDERVLAWLVASLRFEFFSYKQLLFIVRGVYEQLCKIQPDVKGALALVRFVVRDKVEAFIQGEVDRQTQEIFDRLFDSNRVRFYLECVECRFEVPSAVELHSLGPLVPLTHDDGKPLKRSLYDFVDREDQNTYERAVALVLDRHVNLLWWFRNRVGPENFAIQGYRRQRIYPDFVAQTVSKGHKYHRVLVIESKGKHLEGNPDTVYKRAIAKYFDRAGKRITWHQLGKPFKDHVFTFEILDEAQPYGRSWQDEVHDLLARCD